MDLSGGIALLLPRSNVHPLASCTIETCPVSESAYGYLPNKPLNIAFMAIFILSLVVHIAQSVKHQAWTFLIALALGTLTEAVGYVGRIQMHKDPFNRGNLAMNIIFLTVAPAFIAAGIYLILKHLVIILGIKYSRFAPKWYTRIFISCDIVSLVVQTAGASLSSSTNESVSNAANPIMETGIAFQVLTLLIFGFLVFELYLRYKQNISLSSSSPKSTGNQIPIPIRISTPSSPSSHQKPLYDRKFKRAVIAVVIAYFAILIRCIYRIAEMAGGLRNPIMQDQVAFVMCDGTMCIIACVALNIFHPGNIFQVSKLVQIERGNGRGNSADENVETEMVAMVQAVGTSGSTS